MDKFKKFCTDNKVVLIVAVIIVLLLAAWYFTKDKTEEKKPEYDGFIGQRFFNRMKRR